MFHGREGKASAEPIRVAPVACPRSRGHVVQDKEHGHASVDHANPVLSGRRANA